jgi:hypothetical protein
MPPQQGDGLLDLVDGLLDVRAHLKLSGVETVGGGRGT